MAITPTSRAVKLISAGAAGGATGAAYNLGFSPSAVTVAWTTSGGASAIVGGQLQASFDNVNWFNVGSAQTAASGNFSATPATTNPSLIAPYWRFAYTSITGGTTPTITVWLGARN